ncbi:30S ribosomal protein S18 [Patescibacteria group bacterium]|jgi:small subunit ribosomal protein S18|nr:30S ribosomal protein S18 [Patescibacteria group bacterium]
MIVNNQKHCYFCVNNIDEIDYKDTELLRRFISNYEKILPRKKKGVCLKHQKKLSRAIKRARIMALLPFVRK